MNEAPMGPGWVCSECGAEVYWPSNPYCWLCGGAIRLKAGQEEAVPAVVLHPSRADRDRRVSDLVSLSMVLMLMTLAAVLFGILIMAPGLGIALAFFTLPALIVSGFVLQRKKSQGQELSKAQKVGVFLQSFGLIVAVTAATVFALVAALFVVCLASIGGFKL